MTSLTDSAYHPSLADELSQMGDRITQLQNGLDGLVTIMYSTLSYLQRRSTFRPVNGDMPITQTIPDAEDPSVFEANCKELVDDFMRKAKQIEHLIAILPPQQKRQSGAAASNQMDLGEDQDFATLEAELQSANREYMESLRIAETLHEEIKKAMRNILGQRQTQPTYVPPSAGYAFTLSL